MKLIKLEAAAAGLRHTRPVNRAQSLEARSWYRVTNNADGGSADVSIFEEIGFYGVTAGQFVEELNALEVEALNVHINSPGGDVYDGVAIYNALLRHPAMVTTYVDGLAASAASVIMQAGTVRVMAKASQTMIHEASALCMGNAQDMTECAAMLDKVSDMIAQVYADRAGGRPASWRAAMRAETWYSPEEAVSAGLADAVRQTPASENTFDLSKFRHAGREHAPKPPTNMANWNPDVVRQAFASAFGRDNEKGSNA